MPKTIYQVSLSQEERKQLAHFVKQGKKSARAITRARILLCTDEHKTDEEIMGLLGVCRATVHNIRKKYATGKSLQEVLQEKPRSGAPPKLDSRLEVTITMIACSTPPAGYNHWTLHLIAEKLVALEAVDSISYVTVRTALKKRPKTLVKETMVHRSN